MRNRWNTRKLSAISVFTALLASVLLASTATGSGVIQPTGIGDPSWPAQCPQVIDSSNADQPQVTGFYFDATGETFTRLADGKSTPATSLSNLVGCYADLTNLTAQGGNNFQIGTISRDDTGFYWLNAAGVRWGLTASGNVLTTDTKNPYYSMGHTFKLFNSSYVPNPNSDPSLTHFNNLALAGSSAPTGGPGFYVTSPVAGTIPDQNKSGFSWYTTLFPLLKDSVPGLQIGLSSTWILPDVKVKTPAVAQQLCGEGSNPQIKALATDPKNGNYGYALFQTIEGSLGWWVGEKYPSTFPKYQPNVSENCYETQQATPGWGFYDGTAIPREHTGLIQITNKLLLPPDGMTFQSDLNLPQLGVSWLSLPLPNFDHKYGNIAGSNAWTLFMNTQGFNGPVEFVAPQFWADGSLVTPIQKGLGLDTLDGFTGVLSSEWNSIPYYETTGSDGKIYSKIPQLQFPSDSNNNLVFSRDFYAYSKDALANQFATAMQNNSPLPQQINSGGTVQLKLGGESGVVYEHGDTVPSLTSLLATKPLDSGAAFGLTLPNPSQLNLPSQYYKSDNGVRSPVSEDSVPPKLAATTFATAVTPSFTYESPAWWSTSPAASKTFSAQLNDGSSVDYKWYKFVDQPALQRFELTDTEKTNLQNAAEKIQKEWSGNTLLNNPSSGTLAKLDNGLSVTPPSGLEIGYVPIVVRQYFGSPTALSTPTPSPIPTPMTSSTKYQLCVNSKGLQKKVTTTGKCPAGFKTKKH